MRTQVWSRRDALVAYIVAATAAVLAALGVPPATAAGTGVSAPPRDREGRRRWALARMDEVAQERLRCRERFRVPRQVHECEAECERRHRAYNEVYIEAVRD